MPEPMPPQSSQPTPPSRPSLRTAKTPACCPECGSTALRRRGRRLKKLEYVQLWQCTTCKTSWTPAAPDAQDKTYPPRIIKDILISYGLGRSQLETQRYIAERRGAKLAPSLSTISRALTQYAHLVSITRIRAELLSVPPRIARTKRDRYRPDSIIKKIRLYHRQIYDCCFHRAKLDRLARDPQHAAFRALVPFLETIRETCPHDLFTGDTVVVRGSQLGKDHDAMRDTGFIYDPQAAAVSRKQNAATSMAAFIVPTVGLNKARHPELQRFFLACDTTTLAVEIPVWLDEVAILELEAVHGRRLIPYTIDRNTDRPHPRLFTGHIDFIQVRNGALHILDYKPGSREDRPVAQLTLYALAISHLVSRAARAAHLPELTLSQIKCAWFDEFEYNEFSPSDIVSRPIP